MTSWCSSYLKSVELGQLSIEELGNQIVMQLQSLAVICFLCSYLNALVSAKGAVDDLCSLPAVTGPCRAAFPRWFYNSTAQRCESFTYGGCGGNANRFKTIELCESACQCDQCTLQKDPGPCKAYIPSYYYNVNTRKCEKFIYGGCKGNDNRFSSEAECKKQCSGRTIVIPQPTIKPTTGYLQTRRCSIEGQIYMSCGTACPPTCSKPGPVICTLQCVLGCQCPGGTVLDEDNKRCVKPQFCPRPDQTCDQCTLQPETGLCRAYIPSYYWNVVTRKCEKFIYGGCGGNSNRFSTVEQCESACKRTCDIKGQEFTDCGTACPLTCSNPDPGVCTEQCVIGCQCPQGTVLDEEQNRCVTKDQCSNIKNPKCEIEGQEFTSCGTACPPTCSNPNPGICTLQCVIGCQCPQGTVLDEEQNRCVTKDQCSNTKNPKCEIEGQEFTSCGTACPPTCSNPNPGICTLQCVIGCQCPRGTVLDERQNKCVTEDQCTCPPTCSYEYCSIRSNRRKPCSRPPPLTIPACPDQCQTTQCNACYYSENSLETPSRCDGRACIGSKFTRCLKNWALCVEWADRRQNKCSDDCITAENFRCYDYPPCENLRG